MRATGTDGKPIDTSIDTFYCENMQIVANDSKYINQNLKGTQASIDKNKPLENQGDNFWSGRRDSIIFITLII
jgi:hypothetical protein